MDDVASMTETHESRALNQNDDEDKNVQSRKRSKLTSIVASDGFDIFLKVFFVFLSLPLFTSILFFSIYDTQCIVFDQASVVNCSHNFFMSNPENWVFAWLLQSLISSSVFILIVCRNHKALNYQLSKAKMIYKRGSFSSLIFLLLMSVIYYAIRIDTTKDAGAIRVLISILVLLWLPVKFVFVCCLNYLPRVHWQKTGLQRCTLVWLKQCLVQNSNFIIYWVCLLLNFVEVACKLASIMLDVALEVAPLIENNFPDESVQLRGVMVIVIGFRLAYHASLLSFLWDKIFHGETDYFSEPDSDLLGATNGEGEWKEKDLPLAEIHRA